MAGPGHERRPRFSRLRNLHRLSRSVGRLPWRGRRLVRRPAASLLLLAGVVSETYGWFLHRLGEDAARTFRVALADFTWLKLLPIDSEHHAAVLRKLERLRGHKLTYVDASSLVFLGQLRIGNVWSVDQDLAIEGARVVPRSA